MNCLEWKWGDCITERKLDDKDKDLSKEEIRSGTWWNDGIMVNLNLNSILPAVNLYLTI